MPHDIFISYSSKRKSVADEVCRYLEGNGLKCWMAPRDLIPGKNFAGQIDDAISNSNIVVLIFSQPASKSKWVSGEINVAFEEGKYIIPFCIDDTEMVGEYRIMLKQMHRIDAYPDHSHFLPNLLQSIQAIAEKGEKIKDHDEKLNKASEEIKENVEKAEETQLAVDNTAKALELLSRGDKHLEKGMYEEAIAEYNEAMKLGDFFSLIHGRRGFAYYMIGDYDQAIKDYSEQIASDHRFVYSIEDRSPWMNFEMDSQHVIIYSNRAAVYNKKGEYDKAIEDCSTAIELDYEKNCPYPYSHRGTAYRMKGELDKAIEDYTTVIYLKPDYGEAYYNRGLAYQGKANQGKDENMKSIYTQWAEADFKKAKELGYKPGE